MDNQQVKLSLDAKGLQCPLPIIRVKKGMSTIGVDDILEVWTTDPGSLSDFRAWARSTGHELVRVDDAESPFRFWFRRTH
ncbi:MAG: sulfurtransferase TusA family protein [Firmicutes bacterium]|nr:sulfurtransferase TusA family protein [Bacillota bacterium]